MALFGINVGFSQAQYVADVLGEGYFSRTIRMADDYDGEVICTLIRKPLRSESDKAVLYLHGYNDYFFQKALGDSITAHGYHFYALDLRKYGRSILPHQDPFFCKSLTEYFADIDTALTIIRQEGNREIILMGHSTGGLILPLYMKECGDRHPVSRMILNSPFLDMHMSWLMEKVLVPVVAFVGKFFPKLTVLKGGSANLYGQSIHIDYRGEWAFNTTWKKLNSHAKRAGWLKAIHQGHRIVQKGLSLHIPVLVLSSDKSIRETDQWQDEYQTADAVLDVEDIRKYGLRLSSDLTFCQIPNGMHDLILSQKPYRDEAYRTMFTWLEE
ncbi:alpha/beta hydrolase [Parabacteroides sp. PF5-9]|uniref:alpha/beta hydrolase n=1 Tax=Parabacteroides sp. PF5-9 TaxID=1742404 RepID=UPI0024764B7B|nr:alpha/beta hydrolase [Parabacteroides sp. PF5-9]MDH6357673.1 alpha-beta hydrolase superfamily lysophospholipase [Parabacteroides sp. PF5-9]